MKWLLWFFPTFLISGALVTRQMRNAPTPTPSMAIASAIPTATPDDRCSTSVDGLSWSNDSQFVEGYAINDPIDGCPPVSHYFKSDGTPVELTVAQRARLFYPPYRLNDANESAIGLVGRDGRARKLQGADKVASGFGDYLHWLIEGETFSPDAREFYAVYHGVFYAWKCENGKLLKRARLFTPEESVGDNIELSSNGKRALWERLDGERRVRLLDTQSGKMLYTFDGNASFANDGRFVYSQREQGATGKQRNLLEVRDENGRALWSHTYGPANQFYVSAMGARLWVRHGRNIIFYDARRGRALKRIQVEANLRDFVPSPDESRAWGMTTKGEIRRYMLFAPPK